MSQLLVCFHCDARVPRRDDELCSCGESYAIPSDEQIENLPREVMVPLQAIVRTTRWMAGDCYSGREIADCVEKPWRYPMEWLLAEQESTTIEVK